MRLPTPNALRRHRLRVVVPAFVLAVLVGVGAPTLASSSWAASLVPGPTTTVPIPSTVDAYPAYVGQSTCDPTVKPGAAAVLKLAMDYYKVGRNSGIVRDCSIGGQSEHKEGRAFDWGLSIHNPAEKAAGDDFTEWLTANGPDGRPGYNARRLGVMYVIWNKRIWTAYGATPGWRAYYGASPHTDHVHVSLSWKGANKRTSWWTGTTSEATIGALDLVHTTGKDITVRGWAMDPDTEDPIDVHVYVDGVAKVLRADQSRPDINAIYRRGDRFGYSVTLPQARGPHSVCVYAIDSVPVGNTTLGCRNVVVEEHAPQGAVDSVTTTHTSITVSGWALDADTLASTDVHVYVDGKGAAVRASQRRPDVGRAFRLGDNHGFTYTAPASVGRHDLCVYAIAVGPGPHTTLQCRSVVVEPPPTAPPVGALDAVTPTPTGVSIRGWTLDPDTTAATDVHVYIDGVGIPLRADQSRPDVAAVMRTGDRHGFALDRALSEGRHSVCVYALNTGPGPHALLGCRTITVNHAPIGALDVVVPSAGRITAAGWVLDPDTTDPTDVHVYVDGVGVAAVRADGLRPDVAAAHKKGDRHGFAHSAAVSAGRHSVCVYGIDTAGARHKLLGCRTVDVPA